MEVGMMAFLSEEKRKDVEDLCILKEISMRVNGLMIRFMDMAFNRHFKEVDMKECGKTINRTAMEKKIGQMVQITKENIKME